MDSSTVPQSDRGGSPDLWESLKNCVDRLKAALEKWDNAWAALTRKPSPEEERGKQAERRKHEELLAKAMEQTGWPDEIENIEDPHVRFEEAQKAGLPPLSLDAAEMTRSINENVEQQRIVKAGADRKDAEAEILEVGTEIDTQLKRLRNRDRTDPRIEDALEDFRQLTEGSTSTVGTTQFRLGPDRARKLILSLEELLAFRAEQLKTPPSSTAPGQAPVPFPQPGGGDAQQRQPGIIIRAKRSVPVPMGFGVELSAAMANYGHSTIEDAASTIDMDPKTFGKALSENGRIHRRTLSRLERYIKTAPAKP